MSSLGGDYSDENPNKRQGGDVTVDRVKPAHFEREFESGKTTPVVPTWEKKKSENLTLMVLKSGGWTPQPVTKFVKSAQKEESPKRGVTM